MVCGWQSWSTRPENKNFVVFPVAEYLDVIALVSGPSSMKHFTFWYKKCLKKLFSLFQLFKKKKIKQIKSQSHYFTFQIFENKNLMYDHDVNEALYQDFEILGHWIDYLTFLQL